MSIALTLSAPLRLSSAASTSASDASSGGPFAWLQELMGQVPELAQPLILVLAGAIPFFEGEGAAALGVLSGVNPVVAALAAIAGNVLCVAAVVWVGSWVRSAVVARRRRRGVAGAPAGGSGAAVGEPDEGESGAGEVDDEHAGSVSLGAGATASADGARAGVSAAGMPAATRVVPRDGVPESKPEKKGQHRLKRWLVKFGVPGASLLAPLALPTMFTAATLVGTGVSKSWVMLWQVVAIVLWTTAVTVVATGVLSVVGG